MTETRQEMPEITFLQNISVILVVLAHSFIPHVQYAAFFVGFKQFIYSLPIMPLFMSLSGYLFLATGGMRDKSLLKFIYAKLNRLILPYVVLGSLAFMLKGLLAKFSLRPIDLSFSSFVHNTLYPADNAVILYWFLPTLFIIFLFSGLLLKALSDVRTIIFTTILLLGVKFFCPDIQFLDLGEVADFLIYFWIGCLILKYKVYLQLYQSKLGLMGCIILVIALKIAPVQSTYLSFISSAVFIYSCYSAAWLKTISIPLISKYYYQIYLLQWFVHQVILISLLKVWHLNLYLVSGLMFLGGLWLPVLITQFMTRYLAFLDPVIGQKHSPKSVPKKNLLVKRA